MLKPYPFYKQLNQRDCGPSCLRMICKYYGKFFSHDTLRKKCYPDKAGVSLWNLSNAATEVGFRTLYARIGIEELSKANMPCIIHWKGHHYIVLYKVKKNKVIVGDPAIGIISYTMQEFLKGWYTKDEKEMGIVLLLEPTPAFYIEKEEQKKLIGFGFFLMYLKPFKKYYFQLILGMVAGMGLSILLPFLTQSVIDVGINNKNLSFINLVLIAQLTFSISGTILGFIRSWIFLHVGSRISIAVISDYLMKLLKLPISFFETRMIGDIMQRIGDHGRIQAFISSATLNTIFSFVNLIVFSFIMAYYSLQILLIFYAFSIVYAIWVMLFLRKRKEFDYKFFERSSLRQNTLIQLFYGVRDIKLHNYEDHKRWEWERIQAQTFKISIKQLILSQYQAAGAFFIITAKGILISYLSAKKVIDGEMTLGMMASMQFILGQVGAPISQFIGLINSYQDAKISLERIGEIHANEDEQTGSNGLYAELPENKTIEFENVSFSYNGSNSDLVLKNVSFAVPEGKVTAIVGASGSGKTSIIKLLLKFYPLNSGRILIGGIDSRTINLKTIRQECGTVMQDSYIFSDSIAENIALGDDSISLQKLEFAAKTANIDEFVNTLHEGYNTKIGMDGLGLSQGQRQRILIARAVYRNPHYIFLDEATNSLDAINESEILEKLASFYKGRTVIIVAHRLSTIRNADNIIVMDKGQVVESGTHDELVQHSKVYFELVKKQTQVAV